MMITNLPRDLMEEIFSRVPSKSMRAVQLTCREWNSLSKSRISLHIVKASAAKKEGESLMIMMMDCNLYLMFVNDVDPCTELKGKLTCLNEQVKISRVFHCEGLLLCVLKDDNTKVVVWNPYWGQTRWIELRYSLRPHELEGFVSSPRDYFSYALGYEDKKSCRSYKLLRFIDVCLFEDEFLWYELYDFDSDLWSTLDVTPYWHIMSDHGVSLKGNTYWCATKKNATKKKSFRYVQTDHIVCFDYTKERFGPLLPLPYGYRKNSVTLSCVKEERLAALFLQNEVYPYSFDIWVTTMIEAENVSWSKFLTVDMASHADISLPLRSFFIDEVKKFAIVFENVLNRYTVNLIGEAGYLRQVDLKEHTEKICWPHMFPYIPSLVQIKQPKGGQGKNQSNLEKLRYDEYMLRLSSFKYNCKRLDIELRCRIARRLNRL